MQKWPEKWIQHGIARGERRLAEQRFGAEFAMRAEPLLDALPDQERVTEAATLAVRSPTAAALAERLAELAGRGKSRGWDSNDSRLPHEVGGRFMTC